MQQEAVKIVRYGFKIASGQTPESVTDAAVMIKIAADVDDGATLAEAVVRHVDPAHRLEAVDTLYKVAYGGSEFNKSITKSGGVGRKVLAASILAGLAAGRLHNIVSPLKPPDPHNQDFLGNIK
jgi:hypothetical protein